MSLYTRENIEITAKGQGKNSSKRKVNGKAPFVTFLMEFFLAN